MNQNTVSCIFGLTENIKDITQVVIGGYIDDDYLCSSTWMKNSYKRRPQDFKRRIIKRIYTDKKDLLKEEYRYLRLIKKEELGKRYYNLRRTEYNLNAASSRLGKTHTEEAKQKIKEKRKLQVITEKHKENISASLKGVCRNPLTEEHKKKISTSNKNKKLSDVTKKKMSLSKQNMSEETKKKMSQNSGKYWKDKSHSEETKQKIREKLKGKSLTEEHKEKMKHAQQLRRKREQNESYI